MSVVGSGVYTLSDWAKTRDPDGKTAVIVEMLGQENEIINSMKWKEGNLPTGNQTTIRTGLGTPYWRALNEPVPSSKTTTAQVTDKVGILEDWTEVDVELAKLEDDVAGFRMNSAKGKVEGMSQEFASTLFYGNASTSPKEFTGLAPRYSSLSAANAQNIVTGGSVDTDNTSIWLICWGENKVHGIFPKGSKAGLEHEDLGIETAQGTTGVGSTKLRVYRDRFVMKPGLTVADWRYAVRGCNIDMSALVANSSATNLTEMLIKMMHRIPSGSYAGCYFYANRSVRQYFDLQRFRNVAGAGLTYKEIDGQPVYDFRGIPFQVCDAITNSEALVS